jgi:hypothetical protein
MNFVRFWQTCETGIEETLFCEDICLIVLIIISIVSWLLYCRTLLISFAKQFAELQAVFLSVPIHIIYHLHQHEALLNPLNMYVKSFHIMGFVKWNIYQISAVFVAKVYDF